MFDFFDPDFLDSMSPTRQKLYRAVLQMVELGKTAEIRDLLLTSLLDVVTSADCVCGNSPLTTTGWFP